MNLLFYLYGNPDKSVHLIARRIENEQLTALPIHNEEQGVKIKSTKDLSKALSDIASRLRAGSHSHTSGLEVCLIYERDCATNLQHFANWDNQPDWIWYWFCRSGLPVAESASATEIMHAFLIMLQADTGNRVTGNNDAGALLHDRIQTLETENKQLQARLSERVQWDQEALLSLLPALYHQPFSALSGVDLAHLLGRVEPFNIPSPYPEQSEETRSEQQRRFMNLTREQQLAVLSLARVVPHRLRPRQEMKKHLDALE